jgi:hypothetical protein
MEIYLAIYYNGLQTTKLLPRAIHHSSNAFLSNATLVKHLKLTQENGKNKILSVAYTTKKGTNLNCNSQ